MASVSINKRKLVKVGSSLVRLRWGEISFGTRIVLYADLSALQLPGRPSPKNTDGGRYFFRSSHMEYPGAMPRRVRDREERRQARFAGEINRTSAAPSSE